jgi:hypothetical protein
VSGGGAGEVDSLSMQIWKAHRESIQQQLGHIFVIRAWAITLAGALIAAMIQLQNPWVGLSSVVILAIWLSEVRTSEFVELDKKREKEFRRIVAKSVTDPAAHEALEASVTTPPWQGRKATYPGLFLSIFITAIVVYFSHA